VREARHVDRGAAIKIEEVRFGSLPEKAKRTPPRCSKPSEADLELKAGSVHVKGASGHAANRTASSSTRTIGVPGFTMTPRVVSRAPV